MAIIQDNTVTIDNKKVTLIDNDVFQSFNNIDVLGVHYKFQNNSLQTNTILYFHPVFESSFYYNSFLPEIIVKIENGEFETKLTIDGQFSKFIRIILPIFDTLLIAVYFIFFLIISRSFCRLSIAPFLFFSLAILFLLSLPYFVKSKSIKIFTQKVKLLVENITSQSRDSISQYQFDWYPES